MPTSQATLINAIVLILWAALTAGSWVNIRFTNVFASSEKLTTLLHSAGLVFCPGLLDAVQSLSPPSISWFENLPTAVPKNVWAVYALVLRKNNCRPRLYIGSATAAYRGARARMSEYERLTGALPALVVDSVTEGYTITHKSLLVYFPIPPLAKHGLFRCIAVGLEAAFSCIFSAMRNPNKHYGFRALFPWPRAQFNFEYDGLCSHNALLEGVSGELDLTSDQLAAIETAIKEKNRKYGLEYARNLRANPTESYKNTQRSNNKKQAAGTKARQRTAVATKQYYCKTCDIACRDATTLRRHNRTPRHQAKVRK